MRRKGWLHWLRDPGYILKVNPQGLADGLNIRVDKKRSQR